MKTVIFDMDGLMFDTERVFIKAWDYAGEKIGVGKAGYMVYKTLGANMSMSRQIWQDEFGDGYDENELRKYTREFVRDYYSNNRVSVKKGLYELLDYLKENNYKLGLASSSPELEVRRHLIDADVLEYFKVIVCGDMVERSKPAPDIYLLACSRLEEKPGDCIVLEDSKNGLLSAYSAGCKPVMIPDLWEPDETTEKLLFAKLDSLLEVIGLLELRY